MCRVRANPQRVGTGYLDRRKPCRWSRRQRRTELHADRFRRPLYADERSQKPTFHHAVGAAEYEIPARHSLPIPFKRIPRYVETFTADFVLEPRKESSDHHTLIVQGDPQIKDFFWDNSAEAYRDVVIPDIIKTRKSIATPCYGIELGDVIYNELTVYPVYLHNTDRVNMVTFNVIGNHDHDQTTLLKDSLGTMHYEMHLGPTCYSANIGRVHYIFIDDILYDRKDAKESYRHGLYDETVHWLIEDLKYVPKDKIIMICSPCPDVQQKDRPMVRRNKNFAAL